MPSSLHHLLADWSARMSSALTSAQEQAALVANNVLNLHPQNISHHNKKLSINYYSEQKKRKNETILIYFIYHTV